MGYCDPKAIRDGKAWADVVNKTHMNPPFKPVLFPERSLNKINDLQAERVRRQYLPLRHLALGQSSLSES